MELELESHIKRRLSVTFRTLKVLDRVLLQEHGHLVKRSDAV